MTVLVRATHLRGLLCLGSSREVIERSGLSWRTFVTRGYSPEELRRSIGENAMLEKLITKAEAQQ